MSAVTPGGGGEGGPFEGRSGQEAAEELMRRLLPPFYWPADQRTGGALSALIASIAGQYAALRSAVAGLYDDVFLETCADRLVPYFAEELGITDLVPVGLPGLSGRSWVGSVLGLRRRRGTLGALVGAARATSGWAVYVAPPAQGLARTQALAHLDLSAGRLLDLRDSAALAEIGAPWSRSARSVALGGRRLEASSMSAVDIGASTCADSRALAAAPGRVDLIGPRRTAAVRGVPAPQVSEVALWTTAVFPVAQRSPYRRFTGPSGTGFSFHPLGVDTPLFFPPATPEALYDPASPEQLPRRLSRRALAFDLERAAHRLPLSLWVDGRRVAPSELGAADLSSWVMPAGGPHVAVDPELGRILIAPGAELIDRVDYAYGAPGALGGGPSIVESQLGPLDSSGGLVVVSDRSALVPSTPTRCVQLEAGLDAAQASPLAAAVVRIEDSRSYVAPGGAWRVRLAAGRRLRVVAAPGEAPALLGDLIVELEPGATFELVGCCLGGQLRVVGLGVVGIEQCTLSSRSGRALALDDWDGGAPVASIFKSICGAIGGSSSSYLAVSDSLIDAGEGPGAAALGAPGAPLAAVDLQRVTIFGEVHAAVAVAEGSLFCAPLVVSDPDRGLVAHSYLAPGSRPARTFACEPESSLKATTRDDERARLEGILRPTFLSRRYGDPGYGELAPGVPDALRRGGAGGEEMGVWSFLRRPVRLERLERIVAEMLPAGERAVVTFCNEPLMDETRGQDEHDAW